MLSSLCVVTGNELDCGCPTPDHLASVYSARWSRALDLSRFDSEFCSTPLFIWADCDLDAFRGWRACKPFFQILICFFSLWAWKLGTICLVVSLSIFGSYLLIYSWLWPWATVHKALRQWFSGMLWPVGYMQHPEFSLLFFFSLPVNCIKLHSVSFVFGVAILRSLELSIRVADNNFCLDGMQQHISLDPSFEDPFSFLFFFFISASWPLLFWYCFYSSYMLSSASENRCQP